MTVHNIPKLCIASAIALLAGLLGGKISEAKTEIGDTTGSSPVASSASTSSAHRRAGW